MPSPPPWRGNEIAPFTPQKPIDKTTTQMSWFTRSRVVVSANPIRHMSRTFWKKLHLNQTSSAGANAKYEVIVIHNEKSSANMTCGVIGSFFFSVRENSHEIPVRIAMG